MENNLANEKELTQSIQLLPFSETFAILEENRKVLAAPSEDDEIYRKELVSVMEKAF